MADSSDTKQKRSKPCESCRTHRRKCILVNDNMCERCQRMSIPCYFKFSVKPILPSQQKKKKSSSSAKKSQLLKQVYQLEQHADVLEADLVDLTTSLQQQPQHQRPVARKAADWQVCIQRLQDRRLTMDTNITTISDFLAWLQQQQQQPQWPLPPSSNSRLVVTLGVMPVEKAIRDMFTSSSTSRQQLIPISAAAAAAPTQLRTMKRQLIDLYFTCRHLHNPLLVAPYYHSYMHHHVDDMISWATAAYVAYSYRSCHHVRSVFATAPESLLLTSVGELCRLEAKRLLDEALFFDDNNARSYSVSWTYTAYLLTHLALMTLRNKEARLYADACWRMAIEQKETYLSKLPPPLSSQQQQHYVVDLDTVYAESWRRLYMAARFLDIGLTLVNDHVVNVSELASHAVAIGFPVPLLPMEEQDKEAIEAYGQLCQLYHVSLMGYGERLSVLAFRLYMGKLASVNSQDVEAMETRFVAYWYGLPAKDRVGLAPLDYVPMDRIHQCSSARALRVNITYYLAIMSTVLRIMPDPKTADLVGVTLDSSGGSGGGERAVLVVSVCCDAIIKMYQVLHVRLPCTVELHWLTIVLDTVLLLIHAKHPAIRHRAQQGARAAKALFRQCTSASPTSTVIVSSTSPASSTSSTSFSSSSTMTTHHTADTPESSTSTTTTSLTRSPSPPSPLPVDSSTIEQQQQQQQQQIAPAYQVLLAQQVDAQLASKDAYFYL